MEVVLVLRGLIIGFSIASPVGPIGVLCIRRTLTEGRVVGFVSGLGAATADGIYGLVAAMGLSSVATFLFGYQALLRQVGGVFLCVLGYRTFVAPTSGACTGHAGSASRGSVYVNPRAHAHESDDDP